MEAEEGRVEVIDIDLNEEPMESSWNFQNDMENVYTRIEERIRRLEAVSMRARQRQQRRLSIEVVNEAPLSLNEEIGQEAVDELPGLRLNVVEVVNEESLSLGEDVGQAAAVDELPPGLGLKRSNKQLLALALEANGGGESQVKKNSGEAFYDCNVCFGKARDPILTCCGHLYCWPCFYLLPDVGPDTKECPACNGDVNDTSIIPIYGSSDKALKKATGKSGVTIPPRPRANRIESMRQQRINRGSHSIRIEEVLRSLQSFSNLSSNLSSAVSSAERIAEDLENMDYLYHPVGATYRGAFVDGNNSDVLVDVPAETLVLDANADPETSLLSSSFFPNIASSASNPSAVVLLPSTINGRRRIHSQEHFTDLTVPRSRRGRLRRTVEHTQLQQLSRFEQQEQLLQQLLGDFESEENLPDAPLFIDDPELLTVRVLTAHSSDARNNHETIPESNWVTNPFSIRRREFVLDSSEASGSGTPELRRRRLG